MRVRGSGRRRALQRPFDAVAVDIAPLIDMVFQLLIFFMLTSGFILQPGIRVVLPKAETSERGTASRLVITLTKDHLVYWDEEVVTLKELREKLKRAGGHQPVLIRADRHAYVDKLVELWDFCREAGYHEVHIGTLAE